ncbi:hypothetical protein PILCRDRAFT_550970 [Piloderma croceum F 1598]|uniref:Uncharacterized protein n=1 Tax=Piloderma croceum (strain F 1598) TaxID=765440 RepID=A0A0C3B073_PILCF|nr:hypothetical protein PILCRDRAFT_550970 [Piloderma croceum F 1598]
MLELLALQSVGEAIGDITNITTTTRNQMKVALMGIHAARYIRGDIARRNICQMDMEVFLVGLESVTGTRMQTNRWGQLIQKNHHAHGSILFLHTPACSLASANAPLNTTPINQTPTIQLQTANLIVAISKSSLPKRYSIICPAHLSHPEATVFRYATRINQFWGHGKLPSTRVLYIVSHY